MARAKSRFVLLANGCEQSRHRTLSAAVMAARKRNLQPATAQIQNVYPGKGEPAVYGLAVRDPDGDGPKLIAVDLTPAA